MRLFICAGKKFRSNNDMLDNAAGVFLDAGCSLYALNETMDLFPENSARIVFLDRITSVNFDAFLSIGGDGTLLYNSQYALEEDKPILGANAGSLGFLCAFDLKKHREAITHEAINSLLVSERLVLEASSRGIEVRTSVNDVVIMRAPISRSIELDLFKNGTHLMRYRADGVIISTPTGSTAYSFSAGGPVVDPSMDVILITPICAHSSMSRSIVISGSDEITVEVSKRSGNSAYLSSDSFESSILDSGSRVTVRRSNKKLRLLVSNYEKYIEALNNKFSESV